MYGVIGINFVDHFLNQGAPAEHKSAETPIGHESVSFLVWLPEPLSFFSLAFRVSFLVWLPEPLFF